MYFNICPLYRILSFYFIGIIDNAMFPARMRKSPRSLSLLSEAKVIDWLLRLIDKSPSNFWRNVVKNRIYLRKNLPAHLRSILLEKVCQTLCLISLRNLYFFILESMVWLPFSILPLLVNTLLRRSIRCRWHCKRWWRDKMQRWYKMEISLSIISGSPFLYHARTMQDCLETVWPYFGAGICIWHKQTWIEL